MIPAVRTQPARPAANLANSGGARTPSSVKPLQPVVRPATSGQLTGKPNIVKPNVVAPVTTPAAKPAAISFTNRLAEHINYGNWGGANRAPAEALNAKTPNDPKQLERWAWNLIRDRQLPAPRDSVDRAFMLHDLRLKWLREHVDSKLGFNTNDPTVAHAHQQLVNDLRRAVQQDPTLSLRSRAAARSAMGLFQGLNLDAALDTNLVVRPREPDTRQHAPAPGTEPSTPVAVPVVRPGTSRLP